MGLKIFDYDEFMHYAIAAFMLHEGHQRYGQFLVNRLRAKYPDIYAKMPEEADCFYDDNKCSEFLRFISSHDGSHHGTAS